MADRSIQLTVKVNSQTGELDVLGAKFKGVSDKAKETSGSFMGLEGSAGKLLKGFLGFASVTSVITFFSMAVKGAEEENQALRRLQFTVESTGKSWKENEQQVLAWAKTMQAATRFSDGEALMSLDKLVRVTGDLAQAEKAAQLAMGLSSASGKELNETVQFTINLLSGNQRALIEANKEFGAFTGGARTTQEALDSLSRAFGDAAFNEEGLTSGVKKLKNSVGELGDQLGQVFIPFLTDVVEWTTKVVAKFDVLSIKSAGWAAAISRAMMFDVAGAKRSLEEMEARVLESEAKRTQSVIQGADVRLVARVQKAQEEALKIEEMEAELDRRLTEIGQQTLDTKLSSLNAEMVARRAKINREVADEAAKSKLLAKLEIEHLKRTDVLTKAEVQMKTAAALQIASISIQALQTLNAMSELKSKEDARRAKFLLALEKSIAIAIAIREAQKGGPFAAGIAAAQIALIGAQFAQQSRAIDQAQRASSAGASAFTLETALPGGGTLNESLPGVGGVGGTAGAPAGGGGFVGGGGGGGASTSINVGGVVVNFHADHVDLSELNTILRRIGDAARSGTVEGLRMSSSIFNAATRNSGLAV